MRPSPFHKGSGKPKTAAGASNLGPKPAAAPKGKAKAAADSEVSLRLGGGTLKIFSREPRGWQRDNKRLVPDQRV
jgi:hypothetical protein